MTSRLAVVMIGVSPHEVRMVNGLLRVEDLVEEDEIRLLLQARTATDELIDLEQLRNGVTPEAVVRLFRTVRHPSMPILLGRTDLEGLGPVVVYAGAPSVSARALLDGPLPSLHAVLRMVERVASVLTAAHAAGVCHRDLHLGQVRVEVSGVVRLHGWAAAASGARNRRITFDTAAYLAPEALQRRDVWASDVYALGVVLLELVAGQRVTPASVSVARAEGLEGSIRARVPGVDPGALDDLVGLIRAMLDEDWEARPLAMEVARRCTRLGARIPGIDLLRYATSRVPATLAVRGPAAGWAGRRLVPRVSAPAPQLTIGWTLARA